MSTFNEYSSLLQLGFGVGIAVSIFRAPADVRCDKIENNLGSEIAALGGIGSEFARAKRRDLMTLKVRFLEQRIALHREQMPYLIAAWIGAAINLLLLILASVDADVTVRWPLGAAIIFFSTVYYVVIGLCLEHRARTRLSALIAEIDAVQSRIAPGAAG